jgi:hypothetical protein
MLTHGTLSFFLELLVVGLGLGSFCTGDLTGIDDVATTKPSPSRASL